MLQYQTINPKTLELLKNLQKINIFQDLRLVGGTGLALQIGHRRSIDLDLFGTLSADKICIHTELKKFGNLIILNQTKNIHQLTINNIKIDIVNYPYPWLHNPLEIDNIKLAHIEDIAAMKLSAITSRGTKKDFIDIHFLLKKFSLTDLLNFYTKKYTDSSRFLVLKSLVYFEDAEDEPLPEMLEKVNWDAVKYDIKRHLKNNE